MLTRDTLLEDAGTLIVIIALCNFLWTPSVAIFGRDFERVFPGTPLTGTLLRFRVNYQPKPRSIALGDIENPPNASQDLRTDASGDQQGRVRGYLHMLKRTRQIEVRVCSFFSPVLLAHLMMIGSSWFV